MARRPLELPADVAREFVEAMRAYYAEKNPMMREQIAVLQLRTLEQHYRGKLRVSDIKAMFQEMSDHLSGDKPKRR
jgi:hypothetical protein